MIGATVSHYRILGKIGGGGMGVVYEAEDLRLGRHVALKFVPDNLIGDQKSLDRFEREARAASRLNHPNICTIHEIDDNNGHPFIVMEKLEGQSLKQKMQGKPVDLATLLDVAVQVAEALEASHAKGIIHRDIKPANIFITQAGQVKLLDFGLAKLSRDGAPASDDTPYEDSLTAVGVVPGTAVYMAPEQARGEDLDQRSDIFSFGVVLYEMATGKKPFRGTNVVTTLDAMLHQKPPSPLSINPNLPRELEGVIGKAMEKERSKRYPSASPLKTDLQHLKRAIESGSIKAVSREMPLRLATSTFAGASGWQKYVLIAMGAILVTVLSAVGAWWFKHRGANANVGKNTVAVLPMQNINGDFSVDFLRFALADEIANVLTYTRTLDVRPPSMTRKYVSPDLDPQRVGREIHVATLVTGHFLKQGDHLLVTVEAVETGSNRLVWETNFTAPSENMIALQSQLTDQLQRGLLPVLGAAGGFLGTGTKPQNQEAYDLYLHSVALTHDPAPNKDAIAVLQEVVRLDPSYAPAWEALGERYYFDATYSDGGDMAFQRSNASAERAVKLDPNRMTAAGRLITNRVERGELGKAYEQANAMVKRRQESGQAHFTLAYVQRYAGMLEEATKECEVAIGLNPGNYLFRSCAWPFMELGKTQQAREFLQLDAGSEWANYVMPSLLLREGKVAEAKEAVKRMPTAPHYHRDLIQACLLGPASELDKIAHQAETIGPTDPDPELAYNQGAILAYCGEKKAALRMLQTAVETNYCAYSNLLSDPLLSKLRSSAEFDKILTAAHQCQQSVGSPAQ
jgi:TolB-like protein/tetratricopeptide (TPR) repeat protein